MDPVNERQLDVLTWIGDGCPSRAWPDYTHRMSARALAGRGLVKVSGHGPTWTATITDRGRAYLENGPEPRPTAKPRKRADAPVPPSAAHRKSVPTAPLDPPAVTVPTTDDAARAIAKALTGRTDLDISQATRGRAVRLLQALADEADSRGFDCAVTESGPALVLTINSIDVEFTLHEKKVRGTVVADEDRARVKYA